jgi:ribonuclease BN (tRNA processing enzyme)
VALALTVLGCAGSTYDAELQSPCSSYLLETPRAVVMLDCGYGSFAALKESAPTTKLDAIFVSHAHRDHSFDLEALVASPSAWRGQPRVIASYATTGALAFNIETTDADVILVDEASNLDCGSFRIECSGTTHQMATLAVHVVLGEYRVVYSSDTGPGWSPPLTFRGANVALIECTIETRRESSSPFHLDAGEAADLADALGARTTVITHVPPRENGQVRLEVARRVAPAREFLLAATGQRLLVDSHSRDGGYK